LENPMMIESWLFRGAMGGALIGVSASLMLILNGRVTGISGILNALMRKPDQTELPWRALFVVGLLLGGALMTAAFRQEPLPPSIGVALLAGALVGIGTRLANGCTSGHGVCGVSRMSIRSLVATATFITTGALAVLLTRGLSPVELP
jgi:uncharacterized membrane protein YedE/YeeE